jgi:HK97 family phage portal protein
MSNLILPSKTKKELVKATKSKDLAVGLSPWSSSVYGDDITPKQGKWKQYYDMYYHHSIVRSAIDKIAKTATNVGYDFVPTDSRSRIRNGELKILKEFFSRQEDFIYHLRRIYKDLLIYGDAFMYIVPDKSGAPHSLKRLPPQTIAIKPSKNGRVLGYVQFDPQDLTQQNFVTFEPHEIMHFRIDDPDNDLYGLSPLASLEWAVSADIYAQKYNAAFFQNSGITGTIISVKGVNPDEIARNRQFLLENYTGPDAAHKPVFLEGDNVSVAKSVVSHHDMGFLEGRKFIILEILAVLDVPPAKIGIMESANRSNSKEQDKSFRTEAISPLQYMVESVINGQFIRPILGVENTKFVHSEGDTRDAIELMEYYTKGVAWGIFNVNEVRAKMGMAPVDGGEVNGIMAPTGFVPLDRLNLFFRPPKPNTDEVPEVSKDPLLGEPMPKNTTSTEIASGQSKELAKSLDDKYNAAQQGIYSLLQAETMDRLQIVKAYSYMEEARGVEPAFDSIADLLKKAKDTEDTDLRDGYFERVKDTFNTWLQQREEEYENIVAR